MCMRFWLRARCGGGVGVQRESAMQSIFVPFGPRGGCGRGGVCNAQAQCNPFSCRSVYEAGAGGGGVCNAQAQCDPFSCSDIAHADIVAESLQPNPRAPS